MEPAPELVLLMERMYRHWEALDSAAFADAIARQTGSLMIGSDPDEWWAGYDAISAVIRVQFREFQDELPKIHFEIEETDGWKEGSVGWVACRALMVLEGMSPLLTRSTVVLHEEGAYWRIVQWHFSMPGANEDALGVGLTTAVEEILSMVQDERPPIGALGADGAVTIMFTDIEGSAALMESLGEKSWRE